MVEELEIIDLIRSIVDKDPQELLELGLDDASARRLGEGIYVYGTDMMAASTDLLPGMPLNLFARKCAIANISDLGAKGARPVLLLASAGFPGDISKEDVTSVVRGLEEGAREYGAHFVGGDLSGAEELVLAGFAIGRVEERLVPRKGSSPGDLVVVTGSFGLTWLGLKHLLEGMDLEDSLRDRAVDALFRPRARVEEGIIASKFVSSSIDSSDGLYRSLEDLSRASGNGFVIDEVPVDPEVKEFMESRGMDPLEAALYGGEEFELVLTVAEDKLRNLAKELEGVGANPKVIGRVVDSSGVFLRKGGKIVRLRRGGWVHFRGTS